MSFPNAVSCCECSPANITGVHNELLAWLDILRVLTSDPCCGTDHAGVAAALPTLRCYATWATDVLPTEVARLLPPGTAQPSNHALLRVREWHESHRGNSLALAATKLVMPAALAIGARWTHPGGSRRSDAHVHHGGIFAFSDILRFRRTPTTREDTGWFHSLVWNAIIRILLQPEEAEWAQEQLRNGIHGDARSTADAMAALASSARSYRADLPTELPAAIEDPRFPPLAKELLVRCTTYVYRHMKIPRHGGFDHFFAAFDSAFPAREAGSARYHAFLTQIAGNAGVIRLELRKNSKALDVLRQVAEAAEALELDAAIAFPTGVGRELRPARAGSLLRPEANPGGGVGSQRIRLPRVDWRPREAIGNHLNSFDVNGPEPRSLPSWIFALTFARLASLAEIEGAGPLEFAFHAGEAWVSPMSGLRRIGEALMFPDHVQPSRIGHGLALDRDLTSLCQDHWIHAIERSSISDIVFDALWLIQLGLFDPTELSPRVSLDYVDDFDALAAEYAGLFRLETYLREGWLRPEVTDVLVPAQALCGDDIRPTVEVFGRRTVRWLARSFASRILEAQSRLLEEVSSRQTIIECCPTSNVWIGRVAWYDRHPFAKFASSGVAVTVNTDNPGFFETDVATEEQLLLASSTEPAAMEGWLLQARALSMASTARDVREPVDWHSVSVAAARDASTRQ